MKSKTLMIVGPTAVGKTALSIKLAKAYHGEIISGDSMQIYRHLDIGTSKVTPEEMAGVPHHLIDICDIQERYTVHDFQRQANYWIQDIEQRQKLPIIVGGTGFYLKALQSNLNLGDQAYTQTNAQTRQKWTTYYDTVGPKAAWTRLQKQDPISADKIPMANKRRIVRALEVVNETGQLFSKQAQTPNDLDCLVIGLNTERQFLYDRINQRVDEFMTQGLLEEARWLYERRAEDMQASKGIGYKELFLYFEGTLSLDEAVALIKRNSRRYAKRQLTYFRNQMTVHWFDAFSENDWYNRLERLIEGWLN